MLWPSSRPCPSRFRTASRGPREKSWSHAASQTARGSGGHPSWKPFLRRQTARYQPRLRPRQPALHSQTRVDRRSAGASALWHQPDLSPRSLHPLLPNQAAILPGNPFYAAKLRGLSPDSGLVSLPFSLKQELIGDQQAHPPYGTNLTYPLDQLLFESE